jgi:hypothetical protein
MMGDRPANFLAVFLFRESKFIRLLQVEPKLGASAKPLPEPKRGLCRDTSLCSDDLVNAIVGHTNLLTQSERRDSKLLKLIGKYLAGVDG